MSKNLGNDVLHEDIGQKMTKLENWWRAAAILDAILKYEVRPPLLQWYSLVSENTPPTDSKTLKISWVIPFTVRPILARFPPD